MQAISRTREKASLSPTQFYASLELSFSEIPS
jgi:hypothetical protein